MGEAFLCNSLRRSFHGEPNGPPCQSSNPINELRCNQWVRRAASADFHAHLGSSFHSCGLIMQVLRSSQSQVGRLTASRLPTNISSLLVEGGFDYPQPSFCVLIAAARSAKSMFWIMREFLEGPPSLRHMAGSFRFLEGKFCFKPETLLITSSVDRH